MSNKHRRHRPFQAKRQQVAPGQTMITGINPQDCTPMVCNNCGSETFVDAKRLHFVSALQSPMGQEGIGFTPAGYVCAGCGELNTLTKKGEEDGRKIPAHFEGKEIYPAHAQENLGGVRERHEEPLRGEQRDGSGSGNLFSVEASGTVGDPEDTQGDSDSPGETDPGDGKQAPYAGDDEEGKG